MDFYAPSNYTVTLRGISGSVTPISAEFTVTIELVNPCPTATLSNLLQTPFDDTSYTLGDAEVS